MLKIENVFSRENLLKVWNYIKPWGVFVAVLIVLRYTGALSGISVLTGRALMETGIMDINPEEPAVARKFNYNFSIRDMNGNVVDVEQFKGKTIFLNIWATWCGPCRMEMPSIQNLYSQVDNSKILFIMLSVDRSEDLDKVKGYIKDKEYTFPVYTPAGTLPNQLQVGVIPSTFVINAEGKIVSSETGAANYDTPEFKSFLENLTLPEVAKP
jgi:thiol-disulfide isomerase/thioredoxin